MSWDRRQRRQHRSSPSDTAAARPAQQTGFAQREGINAFDLFCAYHLGITEDGGYRFQNIHQVAKRFKTNAGVIKQVLTEFGMDSDAIVHSSFDMAGAQVDVMLAPEGINRGAIARELYEQFLHAPKKSRNWAKELEEDARHNERIFGPGRR